MCYIEKLRGVRIDQFKSGDSENGDDGVIRIKNWIDKAHNLIFYHVINCKIDDRKWLSVESCRRELPTPSRSIRIPLNEISNQLRMFESNLHRELYEVEDEWKGCGLDVNEKSYCELVYIYDIIASTRRSKSDISNSGYQKKIHRRFRIFHFLPYGRLNSLEIECRRNNQGWKNSSDAYFSALSTWGDFFS